MTREQRTKKAQNQNSEPPKQSMPQLDDNTIRQLLAHYYQEVPPLNWDAVESAAVPIDRGSFYRCCASGPQAESDPTALYWKLFIYRNLSQFEQDTLGFFYLEEEEQYQPQVDSPF